MFGRSDNNSAKKPTQTQVNKGDITMTETTNTSTVDIDTTNEEAKKSLEIPTSAARRPMTPMSGFAGQPQTSGAMGSGFGQPATTNTAANMGHNSGVNVSPDAKKLVLGEGISISGEINDCDYLVVEGSVKADFKGSERVEIAETGQFKGSIVTMDAEIAGDFDGTLTVNGRLTIRANGKVKGTINYQELAVEAGATIEGKLSTVQQAKEKEAKKTAAKKTKKEETTTTTSEETVAQMSLATGS